MDNCEEAIATINNTYLITMHAWQLMSVMTLA